MPFIHKYLIWIMLSATLAATAWVNNQDQSDDDKIIGPEARHARHPAPNLPHQDAMSVATPLYRTKINETPENLFTVAEVNEASESVDDMPSLPQIPDNPYTYAGKLIEQGKPIVFLTDGIKNYAVQEGDVLNGTWRVQSIHPPYMTLEYLPLKSSMEMQIGVSS